MSEESCILNAVSEILNEKEKYRVYGDVWKWLKKEKVVGECEGGKATPRRPRTALWQGAAVFDHFLKTLIKAKKLMSVFQ